jgi:aerobic carbon-monoxide dehydrogenase small subunit
MSLHRIELRINSDSEQLDVPSNMTLLQMLREKLALTGTKNGCSAGECGACTVLLNGEPVNSCLVLAVECDGAMITTVEGLAGDRQLDPIQQAIIDAGGVQCGFCTPGILISSRALLDRSPEPSDRQIREALVGNLCRCTGYKRIIDAVREAARPKVVARGAAAAD